MSDSWLIHTTGFHQYLPKNSYPTPSLSLISSWPQKCQHPKRARPRKKDIRRRRWKSIVQEICTRNGLILVREGSKAKPTSYLRNALPAYECNRPPSVSSSIHGRTDCRLVRVCLCVRGRERGTRNHRGLSTVNKGRLSAWIPKARILVLSSQQAGSMVGVQRGSRSSQWRDLQSASYIIRTCVFHRYRKYIPGDIERVAVSRSATRRDRGT